MQKTGTVMHGANMHLNTTRRIFCPVTYVNSGAGLEQLIEYVVGVQRDDHTDSVFGGLRVPAGYISDGEIAAIIESATAGNAYVNLGSMFANIGEDYDTNYVSTGYHTVSLTAKKLTLTNSLTLTDLDIDDMVGFEVARGASDANDTIADGVNVFGFVFTYMADQ